MRRVFFKSVERIINTEQRSKHVLWLSMPLVLGGVAASIRLSVKYRTKSRGRWEFFIIFRAKPDGGWEGTRQLKLEVRL